MNILKITDLYAVNAEIVRYVNSSLSEVVTRNVSICRTTFGKSGVQEQK